MPTVVLGYHDVARAPERDATGFTGPGPDRYKLAPEVFAAQLEAIADEGGAALAGGDAPVVLTFDDGGRSALDRIAPALEAHGWRGHFFITTGRIGTPGFLDEAGVRELAERGHDVGSHSHTHPYLTRLGDDAVAEEWRRSKDVLESLLGREVATASIPTGYYEERVGRAAAAAGYRALFTSEPWTQARDLDGMALYGRFAVTVATPLQRVRGLASHSRLAIGSEALAWEGRKLAKKALGPAYGRLRHVLLARRR